MKNEMYTMYLEILNEELRLAMGCTEPIAIAYAAALARKTLGSLPGNMVVMVSGNIIKNVKSVIVPNTGGMKGIEVSAAVGAVAGRADKELEVIAEVTPDDMAKVTRYLETAEIKVLESNSECVFDIEIRAENGPDYAAVQISGYHCERYG